MSMSKSVDMNVLPKDRNRHPIDFLYNVKPPKPEEAARASVKKIIKAIKEDKKKTKD